MQVATRYFEDHRIGDTASHGPFEVTTADVLFFAERFARPIAAEAGQTIRTSGAHVIAIFQRLQIDLAFADGSAPALMAAAGLDEVRWRVPVYGGDLLTIEAEVIETIVSRSKPDRGIVKSRYALVNQRGEAALTLVESLFVRRAPGSTG